jgi:acetyl esterase/lipase
MLIIAPGGGFSMGSSYFYLEFLLALISLLKSTANFNNPAILALEYDLVPGESYPVQLQQAIAGYKYILSVTHDPSKIVVSGDSAGATLILSLLLYLGSGKVERLPNSGLSRNMDNTRNKSPEVAVLISPWVTLISSLDRNTSSDYLDTSNLHEYARQYAGTKTSPHDPFISPGECKDSSLWKAAAPSKGFFISFGAEEVFAPEIQGLISLFEECGVQIEWQEEEGGIHAWPVASLFLCSTREQRTRGLQLIVKKIDERMDTKKM